MCKNKDINSQFLSELSNFISNNSDKKISNALIRYVARNQDGKIIEAITVPLVGKNGLEIIKGEVINFEFTLRIETKNVYDKQLTLDYLQ